MGQGRKAKARTRAPGLDGVRAIAVLAVMGFHEGARALTGGFLGVDIFFVLSGFLITDLLATQPRDLKAFWVRRARRLLPALAVMLLFVTAAATIIEPSVSLRPALLAAITYTSNWYQMLHHVSYFASFGPPSPLQHLWSLAIEEQFYLIWPLILWFLILYHNGRCTRILVTLFGAAASALAMALRYTPSDPSGVYYGTDTHASALLIGSALALALPLKTLATSKATMTRRLDAIGVGGVAVLAWAIGHFSGGDAAVYPAGLLVAAVAAAASRGAVAAITSLPPLRWVGVRSYAMYLWHWPVIALAAALVGKASMSPVCWVAETAVTVALAAASWRFVESPILRDGFLLTCRRWLRELGAVFTRPATGLRPAATVALSTSAVAIAAVAGYGVAGPARPVAQTGLLRQVAEGERISAASQARATPSPDVPGGAETSATPSSTRPAAQHRAPSRTPSTGIRPARTGTVRTGTVHATTCRPDGRQVTAVGDSVMLASAYALEADMPGIYIDAKVGMQMQTGVQIVQYLAASGGLRHYVIVGLGTNGVISPGEIAELRQVAGPRRELILVNTFGPMSWEHEVNATLASSTWHKPHVELVDWADTIASRSYLLWTDGIHPRPAGAEVYARAVTQAVAAHCG